MREKAKLEEEKRKKEEAQLLKPVQTQKVPLGVDPKTILCAFFKAGQCEKGAKCKFSHDLNVGRKVEKKNLYEDGREDKLTGLSMRFADSRLLNWRLQIRWTLGTKRSSGMLSFPSMGTHVRPQTCVIFALVSRSSLISVSQIVCKFFIEAIESEKYVLISIVRAFALRVRIDSVGSGSVPTARNASTGTRFHQDSCSNRNARLPKRQRNLKLSAWKSSLRSRCVTLSISAIDEVVLTLPYSATNLEQISHR